MKKKSPFKLTADQDKAYDEIMDFIVDPNRYVHILQGYSGTGKSTLVKKILDDFHLHLKTFNLLVPDMSTDIVLTATTNKAAESLEDIIGRPVSTIFKTLGLVVNQDFKNNTSNLFVKGNHEKLEEQIVFIDEASYIDRQLFQKIFERTERCKILFIGDPAQLIDFKSKTACVFDTDFTRSTLEQVVRQVTNEPDN